jgi:hypothetical protein
LCLDFFGFFLFFSFGALVFEVEQTTVASSLIGSNSTSLLPVSGSSSEHLLHSISLCEIGQQMLLQPIRQIRSMRLAQSAEKS